MHAIIHPTISPYTHPPHIHPPTPSISPIPILFSFSSSSFFSSSFSSPSFSSSSSYYSTYSFLHPPTSIHFRSIPLHSAPAPAIPPRNPPSTNPSVHQPHTMHASESTDSRQRPAIGFRYLYKHNVTTSYYYTV